MAQLEKRKAVILNTLLEREDYITAQQLAAIAGASVRTIKSDIAALNKLVENCGVQIHSVPNRGYRLEQGEDADLSELSLLMDDSELRRFYKVPQDANERIYYLIRKLLVVDYPLETGELADEIYVSEPTVVRDLQKARIILVTHFPKSPAASFADVILQCGANEGPLQLGSVPARMAQLFVVDVLFAEVCRRSEGCQQARERVAAALAAKHI